VGGLGYVALHCKEKGGEDKSIAIYVRDLFLTMKQFQRVQIGPCSQSHCKVPHRNSIALTFLQYQLEWGRQYQFEQQLDSTKSDRHNTL
jgi:hypothetical protein